MYTRQNTNHTGRRLTESQYRLCKGFITLTHEYRIDIRKDKDSLTYIWACYVNEWYATYHEYPSVSMDMVLQLLDNRN